MPSLVIVYDKGKFKNTNWLKRWRLAAASVPINMYTQNKNFHSFNLRKNWLKFYFKVTFTLFKRVYSNSSYQIQGGA